MGFPLARMNDPVSHGGVILTGSDDRTVDGRPVARLGDTVFCAQHGVTTIATVQSTPQTDNRLTAHVQAICACGAIISTGSDTTEIGIS